MKKFFNDRLALIWGLITGFNLFATAVHFAYGHIAIGIYNLALAITCWALYRLISINKRQRIAMTKMTEVILRQSLLIDSLITRIKKTDKENFDKEKTTFRSPDL